MQIYSSRLMFCHSALSAIKLAPVLKSPADNIDQAGDYATFPLRLLPTPRCHTFPHANVLTFFKCYWLAVCVCVCVCVWFSSILTRFIYCNLQLNAWIVFSTYGPQEKPLNQCTFKVLQSPKAPELISLT